MKNLAIQTSPNDLDTFQRGRSQGQSSRVELCDCSQENITARATVVTSVLTEILSNAVLSRAPLAGAFTLKAKLQ